MSEWWKYTISDFLLFSPRTYYRLIERYNEAVWPAHLLALGMGLVILWQLSRPSARQAAVVSAVLALAWAWVGWAFLWRRYATINWTATYAAWLFALEVVLLLGVGVAGKALSFRIGGRASRRVGLALLIAGLALYPVIAPALGRGLHQAEVFGVLPDPTALATLGVLLLADGRSKRLLMVVPVLWCLFSGATLWAMWSVR